MLEKDHFKKSSCIYGKVKSKADYLEIRFLPFTAVTPAGILGLHIVRAGREERSLPGGGASLASASSPAPAFPLRSWCCVAMAGSAASSHFRGLGVLPCTPEPAG